MASKKEVGTELGIVGFTLGILSIIFLGNNGIIISVVGFIFSMIQHRKKPTKFSKAGIILNIIGFVLAVVFIFVLIKYIAPLLSQSFPAV